MPEDSFILEPVFLARVRPDRVETVTIEKDGIKALMVFRTPEDAARHQEHTGKHTSEEGFKIVDGVSKGGAKVIAAALKTAGCGWVALPEPWTGDGAVDVFTAENFLRLLEERTLVES